MGSNQDTVGEGASEAMAADERAVEPQSGVSERADDNYEPSAQWVVWAIMFGVLIFAIVVTI